MLKKGVRACMTKKREKYIMAFHFSLAALDKGTWFLPRKNVNILHSVIALVA